MANSKKIWWQLPVASIALGGLVALLLQAFSSSSQNAANKEGLAFAIILLLAASQALWIVRAYPTKVGLTAYAFATGMATGILAAWLHGLLAAGVLHVEAAANIAALRWVVYPALLLLFSVVIALQRRLAETERRYTLQQDAAALLREAELFKLRQQLQPHFLYNSLNAISALIIIAPDKAGEMLSRLADFLRAAVRQGSKTQVPLAEELDYLRQYLWIEAARFGDRLRIEWAGIDESADVSLPPLLLQPLAENAVRYGVYGATGEVIIRVEVALENRMLSITITNPYDAAMKAPGGTGFGLEGVRRRLYLLYARQDLLRTQADDGMFTTTILIPQ